MTTTAVRMARREYHAAVSKSFAAEGARALLGNYRGRYAAVLPGFEFKPGYIYTQVRAISARINQNFDGWPSSELRKSYRTFLGKPVFVNHQNFDPKLARGKVIAARYIENGRDKYVEVVQEIDAARFPKLAHEISSGGMDSVSMGVEAGFTICSYCGKKAVDVPEFCAHVKYHKGQVLPRINAKTGAHEDVLVYEKCYKLGFFELSYVFDPADETSVVTRVLSASRYGQEQQQQPPSEIQVGELPYAELPTPMMPTASLQQIESRIDRLAYGEAEQPDDDDCFCTCEDHDHQHWQDTGEEAPEDVDTLREDDDDDTDEFKHYVESPKELRGPDLDQTKRLDRAQEEEGLDVDRRAEDVEDVGGTPMPSRNARRRRARRPSVLMDPRTGRRYYAADDDLPPQFGGGDDGGDGGDDGGDGGPPDTGMPPGASDEDLIEEAEEDLQKAEDEESDEDEGDEDGGPPPDFGEDGGGEDEGEEEPEEEDEDQGPPPEEDHEEDHGGGSAPPWLDHAAGRNGNQRRSTRNKRRARRGAPMSLAARSRVASAGRRRHFADDSGHVDGGPYHTDDNDQGEQEDVFLSDTPGAEALAAPTPGDGTISNTENNLVARIQRRSHELQRDMIAYEQITGRRLGQQGTGTTTPGQQGTTTPGGAGGQYGMGTGTLSPGAGGAIGTTTPGWGRGTESSTPDYPGQAGMGGAGQLGTTRGGRRYYGEATEQADKVDPTVQDPGGEKLTGDDFDSLALDDVETQPHNASLRPFHAFNSWLYETTGRTARQHGNPRFIRREAARFCQATGIAVDALYPALGMVLREARRNEGSANMRRYADEKLEVAAPQDRIDVEAPVRDTTDADAQASQFDLGDFGDNAGDGLADPDLDTDSQIWAPGETPAGFNKGSNRKADGITAVRYAEAFIRAGLAPNTPDQKWKIAGLAQTMRHGTIVDRTKLLDAINAVQASRTRRTAGVVGGGTRGLPPGFGQRQLTAGSHMAASDISTDVALFIK